MEKPTFERFKDDLSTLFNEPLTSKDQMVAFNFWTNWQEIIDHTKTRRLRIALPSFVLDNYVNRKYPWHKMFKRIRNASMAVLSIATVSSFVLAITFAMPGAIIFTAFIITPLTVAGMLPYSYVKIMKSMHGFNLLNKIEDGIKSDEPTRSMMALCAAYISGQMGLQTRKGIASWPDYPAVAL